MNTIAVNRKWPETHPREFLAIAAVSWLALYWALAPASDRLNRTRIVGERVSAEWCDFLDPD